MPEIIVTVSYRLGKAFYVYAMLRVEFYIIYGVFHAFFKHVFLVVTALLPANKQHNAFYKQRRRIFVVIAFLYDFTVYFLKQASTAPESS